MSVPDRSGGAPGLPEAVVFDVDGTLADTERDGHRIAFNDAFAAHRVDLAWTVERYGDLLTITGGRGRVATELRERGVEDADALATAVHRTKTAMFAEVVRRGEIGPRPGLPALVDDLRAHGVRIAVATTGSRRWVEPLLAHVIGEGTAEVVVCGDDVAALKPDPEAYRLALARLGVTAERAVAVEDSGPGLNAALAAGLATVVVTNGYTADHDLTGAAMVREAFDAPTPLTAADLGGVLGDALRAR